jgi:hypothetical protein
MIVGGVSSLPPPRERPSTPSRAPYEPYEITPIGPHGNSPSASIDISNPRTQYSVGAFLAPGRPKVMRRKEATELDGGEWRLKEGTEASSSE